MTTRPIRVTTASDPGGRRKERRCGAAVLFASCIAVAVVSAAGCGGCGGSNFIDVPDNIRDTGGQQPEPFAEAVDYLNRLDESNASLVMPQIQDDLNTWIAKEEPDEDWPASEAQNRPLLKGLPAGLADIQDKTSEASLARMRFDPADVNALREAVWVRDVSNAVVEQLRGQTRREPDEAEAKEEDKNAWLAGVRTSLGEEAADDLELAAALFDWTIRNIQLELMPRPPQDAAPSAAPEKNGPTKQPGPYDEILANKALRGPGTGQFAWQTLLLGRGDALMRARVFILLCRQQEIDAVMLEFSRDRSRPVGRHAPPQPALAAVLIADELYLFDTELGLPIAGPGGRGVATLQQAQADPAVLRFLDLTAEFPYWVAADDLKDAVAAIDAAPSCLSQRMRVVEKRLSGDKKMVLTVSLSSLDKRLRQCKGIGGVRLWAVPYRAIQYDHRLRRVSEAASRAMASKDREGLKLLATAYEPAAVAAKQRDLMLFQELSYLWRARLLHFRGQFNRKDETLGARDYYLDCRQSDKEIRAFATDPKAHAAMLAAGALPEDPAARAAAIKMQTALIVRMKQSATYWLGLVAYDAGQWDTAVDFFLTRTLKVDPKGPFAHGARYNLARTYEQLGRFDEAVDLYASDASPQRFGNLLRARQLKTRLPKQAPKESPDR